MSILPVVTGDRVFVTTFIEVFCLAADLDKIHWQGPEMDGIHGTPVVQDGVVFVNSGGFQEIAPQPRAFAVADGTEQWTYETGAVSKSTPAVANGRVFIGTADGLHAVDASTGDQLYTIPEASNPWGTPAATDDRAFIVSENEELLAIDATTGAIEWRTASRDG